MLTTGERQELGQIEQGLRDGDCGFAWRLAQLQGMLPVLAVLARALLRLAAAAGWLLRAFADGVMQMDPAALMALGGPGWPGWESGQAAEHASPVPGRPQPDGTDL